MYSTARSTDVRLIAIPPRARRFSLAYTDALVWWGQGTVVCKKYSHDTMTWPSCNRFSSFGVQGSPYERGYFRASVGSGQRGTLPAVRAHPPCVHARLRCAQRRALYPRRCAARARLSGIGNKLSHQLLHSERNRPRTGDKGPGVAPDATYTAWNTIHIDQLIGLHEHVMKQT